MSEFEMVVAVGVYTDTLKNLLSVTSQGTNSQVIGLLTSYPRNLVNFKSIRIGRHGDQGMSSLLFMLKYFRKCTASDPRDKIYAPLNLVTGDAPSQIHVDYRKPYKDVCLDVARYCINKSDVGLDILQHCFFQDTSELPSWVPDWRHSIPRLPFQGARASRKEKVAQFFAASGTAFEGLTSQCFVAEGATLHIQGIFVDSVDKLWDPITNDNMLSGARGWSIPDIDETYPVTGETMWETCYRTVVADASQIPDPLIREPSRGKDDNSLYTIASVAELSKNPTMFKTILTRRLARTRKGFIGLVPAEAQIGDGLYLLKDGEVIYTLRDDGEHHRFVGESYVHGIMYGEIIRIFDKEHLKPRTMTIK
jgi:hypothetical protein